MILVTGGAGFIGSHTCVELLAAGHNLVVIQDESVGITEADCPDKICISEGFVSKPGATVVCLPHKVLVEVKSAGDDEPDVIPAH